MPHRFPPRYAELHAHSAFSFLDGASQPEELAAEASRLGLRALALTDHDGLYGVVRFAQAAKAVGLPTVFGAELHLPAPDGRRHPREKARVTPGRRCSTCRRASPTRGRRTCSCSPAGPTATAPCPARSRRRTCARARRAPRTTGWRSSRRRRPGSGWCSPAAARGRSGARSRAGTRRGSPGVSATGVEAARTELDRLVALFGRDNVAVEITAAGDPYDADRADALAHLAADAGLPLVATGNVHYATPRDADLAAALAAVRARSSLEDLDGWLPGGPMAHLRSATEMLALHRRHPSAVATAADLADECAFDLSLVAPKLPPYPVPPGHTEATWLRELVRRGALELYGPPESEKVPGAYAQLAHELDGHRGPRLPGVLPRGLRPGRLLPAQRDPGAGPRLGRQLRGLLRAAGHRRGRGAARAAVRAVPRARARRAAGHRRRHRVRRAARRSSSTSTRSTAGRTPRRWPTSSPTGRGRRSGTPPGRSGTTPGSRTRGRSRSSGGGACGRTRRHRRPRSRPPAGPAARRVRTSGTPARRPSAPP